MTISEALNALEAGCTDVAGILAKLKQADCFQPEDTICRTCPIAQWLRLKTGEVCHVTSTTAWLYYSPGPVRYVSLPSFVSGTINYIDNLRDKCKQKYRELFNLAEP